MIRHIPAGEVSIGAYSQTIRKNLLAVDGSSPDTASTSVATA